jgi:hypothetical protein
MKLTIKKAIHFEHKGNELRGGVEQCNRHLCETCLVYQCNIHFSKTSRSNLGFISCL